MNPRKWFTAFDKLRGLRDFAEQKFDHDGHEGGKGFSCEVISVFPVAAALWLTGCMIGPDYHRPSIKAPVEFRASASADSHSIADLKWFEVFRDEQLHELIRTALVQNYDLRDAVARVEQARGNLGIVQADQYPNFGAGADLTSVEQSRRGQFTIPRGTDRQR